jgi:8-oxo-dGTP pyrophosphatase MutT (NUDIX family)
MRLAVAAYNTADEPPAELVSSVRCIVRVGDEVLVYEDSHPSVDVLPGGRCEPGETWPETARREVLEETGWRVDPTSLSQLGFIHFRHLTPVPEDHPFPNPDFLQVVLFGEGHNAPQDWVDVEGYVVRSWLVPLTEALELPISAHGRAFLALLVR